MKGLLKKINEMIQKLAHSTQSDDRFHYKMSYSRLLAQHREEQGKFCKLLPKNEKKNLAPSVCIDSTE